jgi:hypothetical protein
MRLVKTKLTRRVVKERVRTVLRMRMGMREKRMIRKRKKTCAVGSESYRWVLIQVIETPGG